MKKMIKVLVVDDSLLYREVLERGLSSDRNINVVATATDPFDARNKIIELEPDVMICDVEMPKMNGIEFIKRLMPQYPLPIIVISAANQAVFDAISAGAVDFVAKPDIQFVSDVETFIYEIIDKVKIAASSHVQHSFISNVDIKKKHIIFKDKMIVLGASTGGVEAICYILKRLPVEVPGIVIVQHIPAGFSKMFADRLNTITNFSVKEAETGDGIKTGHVLIAPGDRHMKIIKYGSGFGVECFFGERINGHCPSADILFESAAKEVGRDAMGVILTGMGYDGAKGLLSMRRKGCVTIGQDESSSVVYGMPKVAFDIGAVKKQSSLEQMPESIYSLLG